MISEDEEKNKSSAEEMFNLVGRKTKIRSATESIINIINSFSCLDFL